MITFDSALSMLFERTSDMHDDIKQKNRQRRTQVTDLFGVEYTRQGDGGAPATFYVSISPDMMYLERFACKLIIQPFVSTVSGGTQSATVSILPENLTVDSKDEITPNPHTHGTVPHTHNVVSGISMTNTDAEDFRIKVAGVDVTAYLMAQTGGTWIKGEGIYPDAILGHDEDLYDFLQVASDLEAEGRDADAQKILESGYKKVEISSSKPFNATMSLYLKYSHMNR